MTWRAGTDEQPLRFPGQDIAAHGMAGVEESYNIFRWYKGGWGRYTQADPLEPGGAGILLDSELITFANPLGGGTLRRHAAEHTPPRYSLPESLYSYGADNPESFIDPFGLNIIKCVGGGTQIIPEFIDPATEKPRRTNTGKLIGECKILLACADPPKTIRLYTTTVYHVQPCPPCPGPKDCLAWVDTATGSIVGKLACKRQ
jgi:hypothetical protein